MVQVQPRLEAIPVMMFLPMPQMAARPRDQKYGSIDGGGHELMSNFLLASEHGAIKFC